MRGSRAVTDHPRHSFSAALRPSARAPDFWPAAQAEVFWRMDDAVFASGEANENEATATGADGVERTLRAGLAATGGAV